MTHPPHRHLRWLGHFSVVTHTGNFHRKGYLLLHHLDGATMQVANLVNYNWNHKEDSNKFIQQIHVFDLTPCHAETTSGFMLNVT